jgi:hypothetical protein
MRRPDLTTGLGRLGFSKSVRLQLKVGDKNMVAGTIFAFTAAFSIKQAAMWAFLGIVGFLGLLALVSPTRFNALATRSGQWIDTSKLSAVVDKRIDVDRFVLPFSRLLGVAVLASVAVLAYVISKFA